MQDNDAISVLLLLTCDFLHSLITLLTLTLVSNLVKVHMCIPHLPLLEETAFLAYLLLQTVLALILILTSLWHKHILG